jgi:hypothetical protein
VQVTRTQLQQLASALADQANEKPFDYWTAQDYPINWEQEHQGEVVQVEIERLEFTDDLLHLTIAVDDGTWPSAFFPPSADTIIKRAP